MKQKQKAFSIIELLVVMVIIGVLATLSVSTFAGYLARAKDTERQVFVRELHRLLLRNRVNDVFSDYRLGGTVAVDIQNTLKNELFKIGFRSDDIHPKEGISYYYFLKTSDLVNDSADDFFVFACRQAELGATAGTVKDVAYVAGTIVPGSEVGVTGISDANARTVCGNVPLVVDNGTHVESGWTAVEIVD